jgi:vacuolar-type H+-ATPase subunit H
MAKEKKVCI